MDNNIYQSIEDIDKMYSSFMLGLEKERVFIEKGILFKAKVKGVNEIGQLILEKENNELAVYNKKEVVWKF